VIRICERATMDFLLDKISGKGVIDYLADLGYELDYQCGRILS
jgi:hypothetical protein